MNKLLLIILLFFTINASAQTIVGNNVQIYNNLRLHGRTVNGISNDTTSTSKDSLKLITEYAAKNYADKTSTSTQNALNGKLAIADTSNMLSPYERIIDAFTKSQADALYKPISYVPTWNEITGKPTTLYGYGITDAIKNGGTNVNYIPMVTATGTIGNSKLYQLGNNVYNGNNFSIQDSSVLANAAFRAYTTFTGLWFADHDSSINLNTTFGNVMKLDKSGNVGINNSAPTQKLDVVGNVKATSFIKTGGTSNQFLKADGSSDATVYSTDANVVHLTGDETVSGTKTFTNLVTTGLYSNSVTYFSLVGDATGDFLTRNATSGLVTRRTASEVLGDIGAYGNGSVVMNTNPFGGNKLYINSINDAFFDADKKWSVTAMVYSDVDSSLITTLSAGQVAWFFDGSYESSYTMPANSYMVITMNFSNTTYFPSVSDLPYGNIYLSHYYTNFSTGTIVKVYCNYAAQGIGWKTLTSSTLVNNGSSALIKSAYNPYYEISQLVATVQNDKSSGCQISEIDFNMDRPGQTEMPIVDKYKVNNMYYDLDFKQNNAITLTLGANGNISANSFKKSGGTSSQFLKADGSVDANNYLTTTGNGSQLTGITESQVANLSTDLAAKQSTLVSGTNIKTVNGTSLLGSGNISISGGSSLNGTGFVKANGTTITYDNSTYTNHVMAYGYNRPIVMNDSTSFLSYDDTKQFLALGVGAGNANFVNSTFPQAYNNTYFGNYAGTNNQTGYGLTGLGANALNNVQYNYSTAWTGDAHDMTAVGLNSLAYVYAGASNAALGNETGYNANSIRNSVLIGASTYYQTSTRTDSSQNLVLVGTGIAENAKMDSSIALGTFTGYNQTQGGNLIEIGDFAGRKTGGTSLNNTLIGHHVVTDLDSVAAIGSNGQTIILGNDATYQDQYVPQKEAWYSYKTGAKVQVNGDLSINTANTVASPTNVLTWDATTKKVGSAPYEAPINLIQPIQYDSASNSIEINPDSLSAWGSRTGSGGGSYLTIAGVAGGRTVVGGTNASDNLTLSSTSNATKGKIYLSGSSYFDESQNQLNVVSGIDEIQIGGNGDGRSIAARHNGAYGNLDIFAPLTFFSGGLQIASTNQGGELDMDGYTPQANSSYVRQRVMEDGRFRIDVNGHQAIKIDSANGNVAIGVMDSATSSLMTRSFAPGYIDVDSAYTLTNLDCVVDAYNGPYTITLPDASGIKMVGRHYTIVNTGTGVITVATSNGNLINSDGTASSTPITLNTGDNVHLVASTGGWLVVNDNTHGNHTRTPTVAVGTNFTGNTTVSGTDAAGTLTLNLTSSTSYPTNAHLIDVTFNKAYTSAPIVVISPSSPQAASFGNTNGGVYVTNVTTTGFSIAIPNSGTTSVVSGYSWNYITRQP